MRTLIFIGLAIAALTIAIYFGYGIDLSNLARSLHGE